MKFDVVSFGSAIWDVFLSVDKVEWGSKNEIKALVMGSGGGSTNTAVGMARLGLKTAVVGRCGQDEFGRRIGDELEREKVSLRFLVECRGEATDYSTILVEANGRSTPLIYRGPTRLEEKLINWSGLKKTSWFCLSSLEGNLGLLAKILFFARQNRIKVAINPGARELAHASQLLDLIKGVEVLIVNEEESRQLKSQNEGIFVITKGARGAELYQTGEHLFEPAARKVTMIDATGAGDAFTAGFLVGLINGSDPRRALRLGLANGASVVTQVGAKTGLLRENEIEKWI
ncbi:MAG: carbohydrate kinase family protein [Candidatus Shapirobacteria bacterium]